eukprot:9729551-Ditylum_brightwellii.AAC.1
MKLAKIKDFPGTDTWEIQTRGERGVHKPLGFCRGDGTAVGSVGFWNCLGVIPVYCSRPQGRYAYVCEKGLSLANNMHSCWRKYGETYG